MSEGSSDSKVIDLSDERLRRWPLPKPSAAGDKEERGHVLVIGGSREMPGAAILAATAALRAGAGKLTIATGASVAQGVALAVPEARVIGMAETAAGGLSPDAVGALDAIVKKLDAVLIGPGMQDEACLCEFVCALLPRLAHVRVVLDAAAMGVVRDPPQPDAGSDDEHRLHPRRVKRFDTHVLLTPHAGEMAHLSGAEKDSVLAQPLEAARAAASKWNALVALKGATTFIAAPDGRAWRHDGGDIGLATSGSGDTLSGIIVGLAARGASLEQASAWGTVLHARAGQALAARLGPLGYLAREIPAEIPSLMQALDPRDRS